MEIHCKNVACSGEETCHLFKMRFEEEWDKNKGIYNSAFGGYERNKNCCSIYFFDKHWNPIIKESDKEEITSIYIAYRLFMIIPRNS